MQRTCLPWLACYGYNRNSKLNSRYLRSGESFAELGQGILRLTKTRSLMLWLVHPSVYVSNKAYSQILMTPWNQRFSKNQNTATQVKGLMQELLMHANERVLQTSSDSDIISDLTVEVEGEHATSMANSVTCVAFVMQLPWKNALVWTRDISSSEGACTLQHIYMTHQSIFL